jgi:protease-4
MIATLAATVSLAQAGNKVPVLTLGGALPERRNPLEIFAPTGDTIHDMVRTIDKAAEDPEVAALLVRVESPLFGLAQVTEVESALARFRATGKAIHTTADSLDLLTYIAVSPSTQLIIAPVTDLDLRGMGLGLYYFRGLLDRLGIEADVVNSGAYKDALDPFTRDSPSEETREQIGAVVSDLYSAWTSRVATHRGMDAAAAAALLQDGPYTASRALETRIVDRIAYPDSITAELTGAGLELDDSYTARPRPRAEPPNLLSLFSGVASRRRATTTSTRPQIAVVYALGAIVEGRSGPQNPFAPEQVIASDDFIDLLNEATAPETTRGLVVRVDSPGGSAIASDRIWNHLQTIQGRGIPVVVSMGNFAASGGYYISMGADHILAEPGTITGSIGVVGGKLLLRDLYDRIGITKESVRTGPRADLYSETSAWSESERARMTEMLETIYDDFTRKAAEGRGMSQEELKRFAAGRIWSGTAALEHGLVDELGGLSRAIQVARELAEVPDATVAEFPRELSPMEFLEQLLSGRLGIRSSTIRMNGVEELLVAAEAVSPGPVRQLRTLLTTFSTRPQALMIMPVVFEVE